jgi:hypothetical protein
MKSGCSASDCCEDVVAGFLVADVDVTSYLFWCLQVSGGLLVNEHGHETEMAAVDAIVSAFSRAALEGRDSAFLDGLRSFCILNT